MEAVELPLVDAVENGLVFLLMPGYDPDEYQGIQFELFQEEGLLNVYCYESGYVEDGDCEGVVFPVALTDQNLSAVDNLQTLRVIDPNSVEPDDVGEQNYEKISNQFQSFKGLGSS